MTPRLALAGLVVASCMAASSAPVRLAAQGTPSPSAPSTVQRFGTRADIVLVDVAVVDARGTSVVDLRPQDFVVSVEGRPRPIQSVQFVSTLPPTGPTPSPNRREALTTTNDMRSSGRLLLIVVDEAHLRLGANKAVLHAAERLIERTAPGDLIGVARLPDGGGVEFTTDRRRVVDGLRGVMGRAPRVGGLSGTVYLSEAIDFDGSARSEWPDALLRECGELNDSTYDACVFRLEAEARDVLSDETQRSSSTVRALEDLASRLEPLGAPVNVVLISEGLFVARDRGDFSRLASLAGAARVSMNIVRPAPDQFDIQNRGIPPNHGGDDDVLREGLEQLAGHTRGGLYTATGAGTGIFDRIGAEMSGYYLLGFEPTDDDRTGRDRRIKVEVRRRGVSVRARSDFAMRETAAAAPENGEQLVRRLLSSPLPAAGLPIRVASYAMTSPGNRKVRMVIAAEVGEPARDAADSPMGLLVIDRSGNIVASHARTVSLAPARDGSASPRLFLSVSARAPGTNTRRLAAVGADGRFGSVHHSIEAGLRPLAGGLELSDVVIAPEPPAGDSPRLTPLGIIDADRVVVLLEAQHEQPTLLAQARVSFEIAQVGRGAPVLKVEAGSQIRPDGTQRVFAAALDVSVLPSGEYIVRAVVHPLRQADTPIERPFRLERSAGARSTGANAGTARAQEPAAPPPLMPVVARAPRFSTDDVLRPDVVEKFIDGLQKRAPSSAAIRPLVEQARAGTFTSTPAGAPRTPQDAVMLSFVSGLAALKAGQLPQATALFQQTLRGAPDFVGIAFYLGACHAANGRDREAVGAWQMSLLSEGAGSVYPLLVDALLRVGENQKALEFIEEAPAAWSTPQARLRREAIGEAMIGKYVSAAPKLNELIEEQPADVDLLFVGIQVLYRMHLTDGLSQENRTRFTDWAQRYEKSNGPELPLVLAWRDHVLR